MKKEIADLWVAALRSGKYKQGRTTLKNRDSEFCCLGVLCDISGLSTFIPDGPRHWYLGESAILSDPVLAWAGMKQSSRNLGPTSSWKLVAINDRGESFEEIALFIEKNYEQL